MTAVPSTLTFNMDVRSDKFNETLYFKPNMININLPSGAQIYFSSDFKYTKTLLKEAELSNILETFTKSSDFAKLAQFGTNNNKIRIAKRTLKRLEDSISDSNNSRTIRNNIESQIEKKEEEIRVLQTEKRLEKPRIVEHNIKFMIDIIFKDNKKLYINNSEYKISSIEPQRFDDAFRDSIDGMNKKFFFNIKVYIVSSKSVTNLVSEKRLECKYKKKELLDEMSRISEILARYIPLQYIEQEIPGEKTSELYTTRQKNITAAEEEERMYREMDRRARERMAVQGPDRGLYPSAYQFERLNDPRYQMQMQGQMQRQRQRQGRGYSDGRPEGGGSRKKKRKKTIKKRLKRKNMRKRRTKRK